MVVVLGVHERRSLHHKFQKDLNSMHKPWLARKYILTNQKQGNPNASGTVSVRVSFPEAAPFFIWSMLAVISFVNNSCRLAAPRSPRMAIIKAILCFTDLCKSFPMNTSKVQGLLQKAVSKRAQHWPHYGKCKLPYSIPVSLVTCIRVAWGGLGLGARVVLRGL